MVSASVVAAPSVELDAAVVSGGVRNIDRSAAHFAILDILLSANGQIDDYRYRFAAVRAIEPLFFDHRRGKVNLENS